MVITPDSAFNLLRLTLPEIVIAVSGLIALTLDLTLMQQSSPASRRKLAALNACLGCAGAIFLLFLHPETGPMNNGMLVVNSVTRLAQAVLAAFTILVVLLSTGSDFTKHTVEYIALILFATAAMLILVSAQNLLVIFSALEMLSLSLYVLTAFNKRSQWSAEAALKYFLFGGMAAAIFLFGISLLYGLTGSIALAEIASTLTATPMTLLLAVAMVMIVTGFGFKIAAAPFHLWAPDAYQGAPTPSAGFIASSSKISSFFVFAIVMAYGLTFPNHQGRAFASSWIPLISAVAAISMLLGNLAAIVQNSVRRLLAYSAIGHAGYMLLGILANNTAGFSSLLYYVITYALATLGAFGVLGALESERVDRLIDFAGLYRRAPWLSFCMLIFLLSLAGIPPLAGFFGKFYVFSSALSAGSGLLWLVVLAIGTSAVSLYYYLRILKQIYVIEPAAPAGRIKTSPIMNTTVGLIALLVVVLGCYPNLLVGWVSCAVHALPH